MNIHHLHPIARRVFNSLPPSFQQSFLGHKHHDDADDFLGEMVIAWLEGRTPAQARASARRFTEGGQGLRRLASLDVWMERPDDIHNLEVSFSEGENETGGGIAGIPTSTEEIARRRGVTRRRAQQILKKQITRAQLCGDLWVNHETNEKPLDAGGREGQVENPKRKINQASVAGQRLSAKEEEAMA